MKICAVVPNYLPQFGGAELGVHEVFKYLANTTTHHFMVVTATQNKQLADYEVIDDVHVYRYKSTTLWVKWYARIMQSIIPVMRLLRKLQPDIIIITYVLPNGLAACLAAQYLNIPVVMSLGGNDIYDPYLMPDRFLQKISGFFIKRSNYLLTWSDWAKEWIAKQHQIPAAEIDVIPFSVDTHRFHPALDRQIIRQRYEIGKDTVLLFALQRLEVRKGVDILIKAFHLVLAMCGEVDVKLLIGGKGNDSEQLKLLINELGIGDRVIFSGFILEDEKPLFYAASDVFVLHSYHEGLGIVLEEAAATGTPQISTHAGGTTDVVSVGQTGLLVMAGAIDELAEAICMLIRSPELMVQMSEKSLQKVRETFSIELVAHQYLEVFERVLHTK